MWNNRVINKNQPISRIHVIMMSLLTPLANYELNKYILDILIVSDHAMLT